MAKECKNCVHKSDFKAAECGVCMVSYYDGEQMGLPSNFEPKPKTNADRIRAMSDEALEDFIRKISICFEPWCDKHCEFDIGDNCNTCLRDWLKQPAEVDND